MIYVLSGGGAKAFAVIHADYPAGSVCTCTKGSKTLTAKNTSGAWNFLIPEAGTWTVTATNGSQTKSATVVISSEGQSTNITLSYTLTLLNGTDQNTAVTGGWIGDNIATNNPNNYIYVVPTISFAAATGASFTVGSMENGRAGCMRTANKIDLTNFSTITWTNHGTNPYYNLAVAQTIPDSGKVTAIAQVNNPGPLDISGVSGECYILVSTSYGTNIKINNIVLS